MDLAKISKTIVNLAKNMDFYDFYWIRNFCYYKIRCCLFSI